MKPTLDERTRRLWAEAEPTPWATAAAVVECPDVWPALEKLVDPVTRADPESPLR